MPEICPVLGIPIRYGSGNMDHTPTLDRINPKLGYVPGNVIIVSMRANRIRNDATVDELYKVYKFYAAKIKNHHHRR